MLKNFCWPFINSNYCCLYVSDDQNVSVLEENTLSDTVDQILCHRLREKETKTSQGLFMIMVTTNLQSSESFRYGV